MNLFACLDGYSTRDVEYKWTQNSPVSLEEGVNLAQYDLAKIVTKAETHLSSRRGI